MRGEGTCWLSVMVVNNKVEKFLNVIGALPLKKGYWQSFDVQHSKPALNNREKVKEQILKEVGNLSGVYIYRDRKGRVLYVGKGKPLKNRLFSHYRESFENVPGDRTKRWHRFFKAHAGHVTVFWRHINEEGERRFIEAALTFVLDVEFLKFKYK